MDKAGHAVIRIIAFKDSEAWVAQCLEYDICAQADDLDELRARIEATIAAEREYSQQRGMAPFEGIGPAPEHFQEMWNRRSTFSSPATIDNGQVELALCA